MSTVPFSFATYSMLSAAPGGVSGAIQFKIAVAGSLVRQGYASDQAAGLSLIYESSYTYVRNNWPAIVATYGKADNLKTTWDSVNSGIKFMQASTLLNNAKLMDASPQIIEGFSNARMVAGAGILSGLVSVIQLVAEKNNIPLNMCALSIAKVSLDLAGVAGGGLTFEFGIGDVLAVMSMISLVSDSYDLATSCQLIKS